MRAIQVNVANDVEFQVRHQQATLNTMLRHGTLDDPDMTVMSLAARIGLPVEQLIAYLNGTAPRWVHTRIARWLSVAIRHWNPEEVVDAAAVSS